MIVYLLWPMRSRRLSKQSLSGAGPEDDPEPPRHRARPRPGRRARRRRPRLPLVLGGGSLALLLVVVTVVYLKFNADIHTFSAAGLSKTRPPDAKQNSENILLIGSDSRAGANSSLGGAGDHVGRSDTTVLVHVYADHTRAVAVSIPRDSLVTIPSCLLPDGSWTKPQHDVMFNSAYSVGQTEAGNPACTQNTVEALTGLKIDHTIVAGFSGFAALTSAVGGVKVCLPNAVYQGDLDPNLGSKGKLLFPAGMQRLSGARALQYVRIRHGLGDGSDIGRIKRQQAFLASVVMKVRREGLTPQHLLPIVDAATANITFDPSLGTPAKLLSFAMSLRNIEPKNISFLTIPWKYDGPRVKIVEPDADHLWQALRADQPLDGGHGKPSRKRGHRSTTVPAKKADTAKAVPKVPVSVYNGTDVTGLASEAADRLRGLGFKVADVGNASSSGYARTEIQYSPEYAQQAHRLASYVSATLRPVQTPGLSLVLGRQHDWRPAADAAQRVQVPSSVTDNIRTADVDPCSGLT